MLCYKELEKANEDYLMEADEAETDAEGDYLKVPSETFTTIEIEVSNRILKQRKEEEFEARRLRGEELEAGRAREKRGSEEHEKSMRKGKVKELLPSSKLE